MTNTAVLHFIEVILTLALIVGFYANTNCIAVLFATRGAILASDILVVVATWWYLSRLVLSVSQGSHVKPKLATVMVQDGEIIRIFFVFGADFGLSLHPTGTLLFV